MPTCARPRRPLLAVMNTQPKAYLKYPLYLAEGCTARMLFSTDLQQWGGATKAPSQPQATLPGGVFGRNHTLYVDLPPLSGALYRWKSCPLRNAARPGADRLPFLTRPRNAFIVPYNGFIK